MRLNTPKNFHKKCQFGGIAFSNFYDSKSQFFHHVTSFFILHFIKYIFLLKVFITFSWDNVDFSCSFITDKVTRSYFIISWKIYKKQFPKHRQVHRIGIIFFIIFMCGLSSLWNNSSRFSHVATFVTTTRRDSGYVRPNSL